MSWAYWAPAPSPPSEVPEQPAAGARAEWLRNLIIGTVALMVFVVVAYYVLRRKT